MPDGFEVRTARPQDEAPVSDLLNASYSTLMASRYDQTILAAALPFMTQANLALLSAGTFYVAETADGSIAGCGGWSRERPGTMEVRPELGHVRHFATHPNWLRRSIGHAIYAQCENAARSAGMRRFECYSSLNAVGFYVALGFKTIRQIEIAMGPGLMMPSMLMERSI